MKRVQRVVVRQKVRTAQRRGRRKFFFGLLALAAVGAAVGSGWRWADRFFFQSDRFRVRFFKVEPAGEWAEVLRKETAAFEGRPIFKVSPAAREPELLRKYPALKSVRLRREVPRTISILYELRLPVARVRRGDRFEGVDPEGAHFPIRPPQDGEPWDVPELVLASTESERSALDLIAFWNEKRKTSALGIPGGALKSVHADPFGEVSFHVGEEMGTARSTRIVWGEPRPELFEEKWSRLRDVAGDLEKKAMAAQYVNLRGVPQKEETASGRRRVVGRVVVRPGSAPVSSSRAGPAALAQASRKD